MDHKEKTVIVMAGIALVSCLVFEGMTSLVSWFAFVFLIGLFGGLRGGRA